MLGLDMRQASTLLEDKSPRRELRRDLDTPLSADKGRIELAPFWRRAIFILECFCMFSCTVCVSTIPSSSDGNSADSMRCNWFWSESTGKEFKDRNVDSDSRELSPSSFPFTIVPPGTLLALLTVCLRLLV